MKIVSSEAKEVRAQLREGIDPTVDLTKKTLGYHGETVLLRSFRQDPATKQMFPQWKATKDGVSVVDDVFFTGHLKDTGASMVRAACRATVASAGDGTTLTAILVQALTKRIDEALNDGSQKRPLKKGIEKAVEFIISKIKENATQIINDGVINFDMLKNVALVASNSDEEISTLVIDAIRATKNGMITVEPSVDHRTTLDTLDGVLLAGSMTSNYFINNVQKQTCELENCYILFYDRDLVKFKPLRPLMEQFVKKQQEAMQSGGALPSLLIICHDCKDEALSILVKNKQIGNLNVGVIKMKDFGEQRRRILEDIALVTDGEFCSEEKGIKLEKIKLSQLGRAKKVIVDKEDTIILPETIDEPLEGETLTPDQEHARNRKELIKKHLEDLKAQIENAEDEEIRTMAQTRYAHLTEGVAVIRIGGKTNEEVQEKLDRVDDALCASRSAIKEGYVAGGGSLYMKLQKQLTSIPCDSEDEKEGVFIVQEAIQEPFFQLMRNAGINITHEILDEICDSPIEIGYDLKTDKICDLVSAGVLDSAMVLRVALENSTASALLFLTLGGYSIPEK